MFSFEKLKDSLVNLREEDESYDYEEEEQSEPVRESAKESARYTRPRANYDEFLSQTSNVTQIKPAATYDVLICQLKTIDDAPDVVDNLRVNHICLVNLEGVDVSTAQRIADFLGGASHAMRGNIERVNESIFIMAPTGINIKDLLKRDKAASGIFSWVSKSARFS